MAIINLHKHAKTIQGYTNRNNRQWK
jgi:hypothetical protein